MKKRDIVLWLILSIVTCGICNLVWIAFMADELRELANEPEETSGGIVVLLSVVTCGIYLFYWYYKAGKSLERAKYMRNMQVEDAYSLIYLILAIVGFGIVSTCLIQNEINHIVDFRPVNNGEGFDNPINNYKDSRPYSNQSYYNTDNTDYNTNSYYGNSNPNYDQSNSFLKKDVDKNGFDMLKKDTDQNGFDILKKDNKE